MRNNGATPGKRSGPSLFLVGSIWHYRFQRNGKRIQRSTGAWANEHARAEQIAWAEYNGEKTIPVLADLVRAWLDVHERIVSPSHLRNMEIFSRRHLYDLGELRIDRISTEDVEGARNRHRERYAPASVNQWLRTLRLLFGWAIRRGVIDRLPWRVPMLRLQKKPKAILPAEKAASWLEAVAAVAGGRWGIVTAVKMMVGLGLRESEAFSARWEWVDWERSTYTPGETKGKEAVPLPAPGWLLEHLESRKQLEGLIVVSPRGCQYSPGITRSVILKANASAGVAGLSAHRLRGTFATRLSEAGMPIQGIQRMLRHKDIKTTAGYLEFNLEQAAWVQEEIAKRLGLAGKERRKNGDAEPSDARL